MTTPGGRALYSIRLGKKFRAIVCREKEKECLIKALQKALGEVKTLGGLIPICANCKKVRNDDGYWSQIESYIHDHSDADFSHSICPDCAKKLYPDIDLY
jgi:hypothetical protein